MTDKTGGLDGALLLAQRAIAGVRKGSRNQHQGYDYASAEDILRAAREALTEAGVLLTGSFMPGEPTKELVTPKKPKWDKSPDPPPPPYVQEHPTLVCTWRLSHPASGEVREETTFLPAVAEVGRRADKAVQAAQTSALAYYLVRLLLIPRVNRDDDIQARDDRDDDREPERAAPPRLTQAPRGPVAPVVESILAEARSSRPAAPTGPLGTISQDEARSLVGAWTRSQGADAVRELRDAHGLPEQSSSWTIQQWRSFAAACEAEFAGAADG